MQHENDANLGEALYNQTWFRFKWNVPESV